MPEYVDIQDRSCEQYLYGLPLAGVRRLTKDEIHELVRYAQNRAAAKLFWFVAGPGVLLAMTALLIYIWKSGVKTRYFDLLAGLTLLWYVLSPLTLWFASRARSRWKAVRRTVETGSVRVFKGMARRELVDALRELNALPESVPLESGRDVTAEMYYDHDVLLKYGGDRVRIWKKVFVTRAAGVPEKMDYEKRRTAEGADFLVRKMTRKELKEMKRYYRRSFRPWVLLGFVFLYSLAALAVMKYAKPDLWVYPAAFVVGGFISLVLDLKRLTGPLRDERSGTVVAMTRDRMLEENPELVIQNPGLLGEELVEVLPNTGTIWREGREPASWRDGCVS